MRQIASNSYMNVSAILGPDLVLLEYPLYYASSSIGVSNTGVDVNWVRGRCARVLGSTRVLAIAKGCPSRVLRVLAYSSTVDPARQLVCRRTSTNDDTRQGSSRELASFRAKSSLDLCKTNIRGDSNCTLLVCALASKDGCNPCETSCCETETKSRGTNLHQRQSQSQSHAKCIWTCIRAICRHSRV